MAIGNIPARKRGFGYDPVTRSLGVYVDGALTASFPPTPGRTYYVNNITGASTNDGLSWGTAFAQVSQAITASTTYRELGGVESGSAVTTNDYVRNTIVVQGTGTAYTYLVDLGKHHNIVGLCQPTGGRGAGTLYGGVRLGADTANTTGGFVSTASSDQACRSVYLANLKFLSGHTAVCFSAYQFEESVMEDCACYVAASPTGTPAAYIEIQTSGGCDSSTFRRIHTGSHGAYTDRATVGFIINAAFFINTIVEDCCIGGGVHAWRAPVGVTHAYGTIVRNNFFGNMGQGTCQVGILDQSTRTADNGGLITYYNNFIDATDPASITTDFTRFVMNYAGTAVLTS